MINSRWGDRLFSVFIWLIPLTISSIFLWIIGDIVGHGWQQLNWQFLTQMPLDAGRDGGIAPILVSTAYILLICMGISLPLSVGTALLLSECCEANSRFGRLVRRSLDILAAVPSIVFGLFGNALFVKVLGLGFSILSGGLTLACMVLPLLIRATESGLRSVPKAYSLSAASLGICKTKTLWYLVLPAAIPGLVVGFTLALGRAIAETAALIFTSGYVDRMPHSWLDSGRSLSIHIYDLAMNISNGNANAYGTATILIILLLIINISTSWLGKYWLSRHLKF